MPTIQPLVECVPNFSEGRDAAAVAALARAAEGEGVVILDHEMDASHNRCVLTFAGSPQKVGNAAVACAKLAVATIDLNRHAGSTRGWGRST